MTISGSPVSATASTKTKIHVRRRCRFNATKCWTKSAITMIPRSRSQWHSKKLLWKMTISYSENSIPISTSIPASRCAHLAFPQACLPLYSRSLGRSAGSHNGKRCWRIRTKKLVAQGKSIPVRAGAITFRYPSDRNRLSSTKSSIARAVRSDGASSPSPSNLAARPRSKR